MNSKLTLRLLLAVTFISTFCSVGCSRSWYRKWADEDAYQLMQSRQTNFLWELPNRTIEPDPRSRLADEHCPDCGPKPCDDPAAHQYMRQPYGMDNTKYWDAIPDNPHVEGMRWLGYLPVNDEDKVVLSRDTSVELALLHSRDFQTQLESVYLSALSLSSNQFEFDVNWFGGADTGFNASGEAPSAVRQLTTNTNIGFIRQLAAGGQLAATLANSFVWELGGNGNNFTASSGSLLISLTQPLLRGAFRYVRLESLTQAERNLLYDVRDFARFRRNFYLNITSGYLALLNQQQSLRNQRRNLESLELNLEEHNELFDRQLVSRIRVDQVFQNYQSGRIGLLAAEQSYQDSLDQFKFLLGLPASVEFELDESLLDQFQLSDPRLEELLDFATDAYQELIQTLPPEIPERESLEKTHERLIELLDQTADFLPDVEEELNTWQERIEQGPRELADDEERLDFERQKQIAESVTVRFNALKTDLQKDISNAEKWDIDDPIGNRQFLDIPFAKDDLKPELLAEEDTLKLSWRQLARQVGNRLRDRISNLFILQTQIRLFQIEIVPFDIQQEQAIEQALESRLDLMNERGILMDSFRQVEIAADSLQSDLDVSATANLGTDGNRAFRFDSSENSYSVGIDFDGPLNRFNERNGYRAAQLSYQAARRNFMAAEDSIVNQIRSDLRSLRISKLNFQISRQQLIAATRQVDEAQFQLRTATDGGDSSLTQDLLDALQGLLGAKNDLISNWTSYEIARINLFVDLELLYLDENGYWVNERYNPATGDAENGNSGDGREDAELLPAAEPVEQNGESEENLWESD